MDLTELIEAIDKSNQSFEEFKRANEARWREFEVFEAKARRPGFVLPGSDGRGRTEIETAGIKALGSFFRTGDVAEFKALAAMDAEYKALSESSGPDGGFAVPKVIDGMIEKAALLESPIRQLAQVVQISTPDYHKLVSRQNWAVSWLGEKQAPAATATANLQDINPPMGELMAFPQATQFMLDDVFFDAAQWVADEVGAVFGQEEANQFINGSGVQQPLGILSGPAPVTTTDAGGRQWGTLMYIPSGAAGDWTTTSTTSNPADVLLKMVQSLKVGYRKNAVWLMHPTVLQDVQTFKDAQGRYIVNPSIVPGYPTTLWGYPIYEAEHMPLKTANSLSVLFGDFRRGYLIVDRIGTRILRDPFSNKPYVGFYVTKRVGGSLLNSEALRVLKFAVS
jgi:HK97 family phage major capsid protein